MTDLVVEQGKKQNINACQHEANGDDPFMHICFLFPFLIPISPVNECQYLPMQLSVRVWPPVVLWLSANGGHCGVWGRIWFWPRNSRSDEALYIIVG